MGMTYLDLFLTLFVYLGLPIIILVLIVKIVDWQVEQIRQRKLRYEYYEKKSQKEKGNHH
ncbi:hypothetical protein ABID52_001641 [Fictibacillus halophilus]|uniref:Uncharacterized protein n=1 Tax=Fictibacillus halophilus TaxID=1610490 RepID=A0ABV2LHK3_9BACL